MELIAAIDRAGGIGRGNTLLYHLPEDMRRFRVITMGKTLLMGKNTFLSLPGDHMLPGRKMCVLTHEAERLKECFPRAEFFDSMQSFFDVHSNRNNIVVIGGASVYQQTLPYCETAFITEIQAERAADRFFLPDLRDWDCVSRDIVQEMSNIEVHFCIYKNRNVCKLAMHEAK